MHFPDKLNIQSVIYTIKYFKSKKEVDIEQKNDLYGLVIWEDKEIRIYKSKNDIETLQILLHEIIHIINDMHGLKEREVEINLTANNIVDILIRNGIIK